MDFGQLEQKKWLAVRLFAEPKGRRESGFPRGEGSRDNQVASSPDPSLQVEKGCPGVLLSPAPSLRSRVPAPGIGLLSFLFSIRPASCWPPRGGLVSCIRASNLLNLQTRDWRPEKIRNTPQERREAGEQCKKQATNAVGICQSFSSHQKSPGWVWIS